MSLNREAKCRKAETQQVKVENEEMGWEQISLTAASVPVPMTDRDSELFLVEHLSTWEMWTSKLHHAWTCERRWVRMLLKTFIKTIDNEHWRLDSMGLPVPLLPIKYPTWSQTDLLHTAKREKCQPCQKAKGNYYEKKATTQQSREQRQEVELARSDFLNQYATVDAFAATKTEEIYALLNQQTLVNQLKPLCKMWGLTQYGKKEEVIDKLIAYIIQERDVEIKTETGTRRGVPSKPEVKKSEIKTEMNGQIVGVAIKAVYTQLCQHPKCHLMRGIAKNEMIMKVKPFGWCHQVCAQKSVKQEMS